MANYILQHMLLQLAQGLCHPENIFICGIGLNIGITFELVDGFSSSVSRYGNAAAAGIVRHSWRLPFSHPFWQIPLFSGATTYILQLEGQF